jgi:putative ABC transport system permease protein
VIPSSRLARLLVTLAARRADRASILADLDDETAQIAAARGETAARRWRRVQIARSLAPLLAQRIRHPQTETDSMPFWKTLASHFTLTLRIVRRTPLASGAVLLALALGIGASTAVMTVTESVLGRPLPFDRPSELVALHTVSSRHGEIPETNFRDASDLRDQSRSLAALGLYQLDDVGVRASDDAAPVSAVGLSVDAHVQDVLGLRAHLGRLFNGDDIQIGAPRVAVVAYRFWHSQLGARADIVGQPLLVGSQRFRIAGVLPPEAERFPAGGADVWVPLVFPPTSFLNSRGSMALTAVARVKTGVTLAAAAAETDGISARLEQEHPDTNAGRRVGITPLQSSMTGPVRPMLLLVGAAASLLLVTACANIGNLFLAQSFSRRREFFVRGALGASRRDMALQLVAETGFICGLAGAAGLAFGPVLTRLFLSLYPGTLPLAADARLDARVVGVAVVLTLVTAAIAAIPRVRSLARSARALGQTRGVVGGTRPSLSASLMAVQVALSVVLLSASLLLIRTFADVGNSRPGFDPSGLLTVRVSIPSRPSPEEMARVQDAIRDVARQLPNVTAAAHAMYIPFAPGYWGDNYEPLGVQAGARQRAIAHFFMVSPDYLDTLGIALAAGRGVAAADSATSPKVIVVSRQFAREAFGTDDAVGRRIQWNDGVWEVVGVANDVRHATPWEAPDGDVYVPRQQVVRGSTWLVVRTPGASGAVMRDLQAGITRAGLPGTVMSAMPMSERLEGLAGPARFRAALSACLAAIALCITAIGVYAIAAFNVTERVREIGVRLALGATPSSVVRQAIAQSWLGVAFGLVPGLAISLMLAHWLRTWLYGLAIGETSTALIAAALFAALATVAAWLPARRASRIDPTLSLRPD